MTVYTRLCLIGFDALRRAHRGDEPYSMILLFSSVLLSFIVHFILLQTDIIELKDSTVCRLEESPRFKEMVMSTWWRLLLSTVVIHSGSSLRYAAPSMYEVASPQVG